MNTLKEVKPLIEWENYLGVWMVDLLPKDHLVEYTKMEAFTKIGASNVRDWSVRESNLYNQLCCNNGILYLEHKEYNVLDNRKKSLIEWEKELGYFILNVDNSAHLEKCTKDEAIQKLYGNYLVQSWDDFADNIYMQYMGGMLLNKNYEKEKLVIKDFECVDVKPIKNIEPIRVISKNIKNKDSILKKIANVKNKLSGKIEEKNIKINKKENKVKVRRNGFKAFVSLTLSLVTAVSMYGFSKMKPVYDNSVQKISCMDEVDDDIVNLNENTIFNNYKCDFISKNNEENIINLNNSPIEDKESNFVINQSSMNICNEKKEAKLDINENADNIISKSYDSDINLGDKIILKEGTKVYDNVYSAIDENNGYSTYYSYDTYRNINSVALNFNDSIIYSNDIDEVNNYKSKGAEVVSVCTDDGFYNTNDIIKVKVKKC